MSVAPLAVGVLDFAGGVALYAACGCAALCWKDSPRLLWVSCGCGPTQQKYAPVSNRHVVGELYCLWPQLWVWSHMAEIKGVGATIEVFF